MASANKLQRLLTEVHGRLRISARSLALAIKSGAFTTAQSRPDLSATFWTERILSHTPSAERIPGTRGGMVWRYLIAIASWEALLLRVSELFGTQARDTVKRLGSPEDYEDSPEFDAASKVIATALASSGFTEFAMARFAGSNVVRDLLGKVRDSVASGESSPYSDHIDFITDLLVQESELADLARLPRVLTANAHQTPELESLARHVAGEAASTSPASALDALLASLIERRGVIRNSVSEALRVNPILDGLVTSRLLPYAEARFVLAGTQGLSMTPEDTPLRILHRDYDTRIRRLRRLDSEMLHGDSDVPEVLPTIAKALTYASVPFFYWCAKAGLDIRRLWGDAGSDETTLWPLPRSRGYGSQYVAFASRVDGRSFGIAMQFLMKARGENPQASCLLVTDQWNESNAAACFEAAARQGLTRSIAVLRSDGPQYPPCAFTFPAK